MRPAPGTTADAGTAAGWDSGGADGASEAGEASDCSDDTCARDACNVIDGEPEPCAANQICKPTDPGVKTCSCDRDYGDCDKEPSNGCEQSLTSIKHCGACGYACRGGLACTEAACEPRFKQLVLGSRTVLGLTPKGKVLGAGTELLPGHTEAQATFVELALDRAASLSIGQSHVCLLRSDYNRATCWGSNTYFELGSDDTSVREHSLTVDGARAVSAGLSHTCLVDGAGYVYCWGNGGAYGGYGDQVHSNVISRTFTDTLRNNLRVYNVQNAVDVRTGTSINCALTSSGSVYCWGFEDVVYAPELVRDANAVALDDAETICAGRYHACALREDGTVVCWGSNSFGQLGSVGVPAGRSRYVTVPLKNVVSVACGDVHTCAVVEDGRAYCWGLNVDGELGSGGTANSSTPVPVIMAGLEPARSIHTGPFAVATCMQLRNGAVYCWGRNEDRQLGLGSGMGVDNPALTRPTEVTQWP